MDERIPDSDEREAEWDEICEISNEIGPGSVRGEAETTSTTVASRKGTR